MRTNFPAENGESDAAPKLFPNISGHLGSENECNVKFPKRLRHNGKGRVLATIYKRHKGYRLYWRTRYLDLLRQSEGIVAKQVIVNLYDRHLRPLFVGA
jgi:hypothetical protein